MDYRKKYEKANNVLTKVQKMIDSIDDNVDAGDFCEEVRRLIREYNKK